MFVRVNGIQLFYEQSGMGRPLILVHGNGEDHTIFDEAVDVLKERYTCYAIDSRGHGKSAYDGQLHYQDMADDITAMMEKLHLENVIYYGFSDGGIRLCACEYSGRRLYYGFRVPAGEAVTESSCTATGSSSRRFSAS